MFVLKKNLLKRINVFLYMTNNFAKYFRTDNFSLQDKQFHVYRTAIVLYGVSFLVQPKHLCILCKWQTFRGKR